METTRENVTLVRNLYAAFSRGDVAALLAAVSPDVEWGEPDNPFNPSAGTRRGHAGVLEWLRLGKDAEEILALEPQAFIAQGDQVVVVGHTSCRVRRTGKTYSTDFAHVVTIAHGKVERFREFFDTFAAAEAFKPDPRPASRRLRRALALSLVFAVAFLSFFAFVQPWYARWGATDEEVIARLPGDDIVPGAVSEETRAITIHAPVERVWPWLAQLGQDRGGFYSYDALENLVGSDMPVQDVLRPDRQVWTLGDRLWMYPPEAAGGIGYAVLRDYIPGRALAFGTHVPGAADVDTGSWAFVLRPLDKDTTRLLVRTRVQTAATTTWLGRTFDRAVFSPMHFAMERRMMVGLKEVAETGARSRLSNHVQVGLWTITLALFAIAVVLVFARKFWGRGLVFVCATTALFAYLTLGQPPIFLGLLLVGWLVLNLVDASYPGKTPRHFTATAFAPGTAEDIMIAIKNVLVATDFSECSDAALAYGRALAGTFGARLHVLHVVEFAGAADVMGIGGYAVTLPNLYKELEDSARQRLDQLISESDRRILGAKVQLVTGETPAHAIVEYAKAEPIDLIVVGTHGRRGISHLVMGSVAEKVVRVAPCPVLTVRHLEREFVVPSASSGSASTGV